MLSHLPGTRREVFRQDLPGALFGSRSEAAGRNCPRQDALPVARRTPGDLAPQQDGDDVFTSHSPTWSGARRGYLARATDSGA
jgi:hypothetical protein